MQNPTNIQDQDDQFMPGASQGDANASGMKPETTDFLNDLAGIGTGAFLDMRQADTPEYQDWRDGNFIANDSGNYVSQEGQTYTDDELEQMHGLLSRQAGNPLVSRLFNGPKSPLADYMTWRNQNFDNPTGGAWEDEDGSLYTEQALQGMFGAKFAAKPSGKSGEAGSEAARIGQQGRTSGADATDEPTSELTLSAQSSVPVLALHPPQQNAQADQAKAALERQSRQDHPGVEILTFQPVGIARSSFGHQAISIDGHAYSFGESGKWDDSFTTNEYLAKNTSFRNGMGQVLKLTPEETQGVLKAITADMAVKQKWTATNNCTTKVRDMLEQGTHKPFWPLSHTMNFAPADFSHMLDFLGYVSQTRQYPKAK